MVWGTGSEDHRRRRPTRSRFGTCCSTRRRIPSPSSSIHPCTESACSMPASPIANGLSFAPAMVGACSSGNSQRAPQLPRLRLRDADRGRARGADRADQQHNLHRHVDPWLHGARGNCAPAGPVTAACAMRNGSGISPAHYTCLRPPIVAHVWSSRIAAAPIGTTLLTAVLYSAAPLAVPLPCQSLMPFAPGSKCSTPAPGSRRSVSSATTTSECPARSI